MLIQRKFKLTSINRLIHPFRFDNHSVYFIAPKKSKFHESFLELYADDLVSSYNERLSKDERLKIDYDYEKFKQTFEEEMSKLSQ